MMHVGKNGIFRDISVHASLIKRLIGTAASYGLFCTGAIRSPVDGGDGNREYMAIFTKGKSSIITDDRYINKIVYG